MIEHSWRKHTKDQFPREFSNPNRLKYPIINQDHFNKVVSAYAPAHNCHVSVYSFSKWIRNDKGVLLYENARISTIFIDMDHENLDKALHETRKIVRYMLPCVPRIYFSGNKGFAIYLDFNEIDLKNHLKKPVIRSFLMNMKNHLDLQTIDKACFDGISRVSRIPNTINQKSGLYCIPLTEYDLLQDGNFIKNIAKHQSNEQIKIHNCNKIHDILLMLQDKVELELELDLQHKDHSIIPANKGSIQLSSETTQGTRGGLCAGTLCNGVLSALNGATQGSRDNSLCGVIAGMNLQLNKSEQEIYEIAQRWTLSCKPVMNITDFALSKKIRYIINGELRPCTFLLNSPNKECLNCSVAR